MILAPMQGLTELLFRRVYEECFPGAIRLAMTPFLSLTHNLHNLLADGTQSSTLKHFMRDVLPEANRGSIPITPQILGKEPEEFVALGNRLYDMGYSEVNWNIGCPMRNITGKHRGSGILPYPDEVKAVLDGVIPKLKPRLSVKMRIGLRQKEDIFALVPVLNDYPLASVTIHPRLGRQQYTGVPDMETFAQVLPMIIHPVIYNGDITNVGDVQRIKKTYPKVADIMVGRGILYRPTLPLEAEGHVLNEDEWLTATKHFIMRLYEETKATAPTAESAIRKTKEYWCMLWRGLPISEAEARKVLREQELTAVDKLIHSFIQ
ncbi:MAG: tRNA-dihydrouridine synthase family protein [Bacteroidales bacterium]|nr:tRNA-dihydrouridine synthase family protein [Bacteroidales bacterium]